MSNFVEECRREWRRLQVPDAVANEMAADLAADLEEAEAEGASAEEVLGNAAFDARNFAASWALERGVIEPPPAARPRARLLTITVSIIAVFVLGGAVAAALLVSTSGSHARPVVARAQTVAVPTITVSAVRVPDLVGLRLATAVTRAHLLGLKVTVKTVGGRSGGKHGSARIVVAQTPPAGASITRGATLSLAVRRR